MDEGRKREKKSEYDLLKINLKLDGKWTLSSYLDQTMFGYNPGSAQDALSKRREQLLDLPYIGVGVLASTAGSAASLFL